MTIVHELRLTNFDDGVVLSIDLRRFPSIEREKRIPDATTVVRRIALKASGTAVEEEFDLISFRFRKASSSWVRKISRNIEVRLSNILYAPLTPKAVDRALGITPRERLHWYKSGRLPICGRGHIGRSDLHARFPLFAFSDIARIQMRPDLIDAWRREDAVDITDP